MNNLRVPVAALVIIVAGISAWFLLSRQSPSPIVPQASSTTTSSTTAASAGFPTGTPAPLPPPNPASVFAAIVGSWRSTDDANYSVAITSSGKWTDSYKGSDAAKSVSQSGTYALFTSQDPDKAFTGTLVPGVVYLKVSEGNSVLFYSVLEAGTSTMQLSYLDRGNTLSFVRAQ
jgi:hypothetical protein